MTPASAIRSISSWGMGTAPWKVLAVTSPAEVLRDERDLRVGDAGRALGHQKIVRVETPASRAIPSIPAACSRRGRTR